MNPREKNYMNVDCKSNAIMEKGYPDRESIHYLGLSLTRVGDGDTTSFDGVEYEDELSFPYVVPAEPPSIVGHH
jgi:hypothetical protein